ncbi:MAG: alpha-mannosidase [Bacteroidetes bacterium GWE2_41_25]|nr:MAG: alpha-mannosidase [Bacteroidetes bacterium GWA2_40_15]OFX98954.1 MAG: alpha-mannosidase [Bacteroidetes bacterium GWC2_40_22]OFY00034.1 MAG: alpha-mannosidase [Bacteroidetes bacterium GWE2_41_25]OFY59696.1 MAG: alpha-mannosidase [Bacteroidetes bacterium GWF2_41_9]
MRTVLSSILLISLSGCTEHAKESVFDPVELVNPLMGTDSEFRLSNGNTYPAIALPWGMNFWSPQTRKMGDGWGYTYDDYKIMGIKQTHQPSPWINDYAAFSLMPITGTIKTDETERASWFSHKAEVVKPYYYSVYLADYDVTAEVVPTERAAMFRFTFPENDSSFILLDGFFKGSMVKIIPAERKVIGYCRNNAGGVPDNFHNYFVAVFDRDFASAHTWSGDTINLNVLEAESDHAGAILGFKTKRGEAITVKVASSFISHEQAFLNLKRETGDKEFEKLKSEGKEAWNKQLGRIKVEGGNLDQQRTFYSCLYRIILFPRQFHEVNEKDEIVHYSPYNGEVLPGYMYTDNGFWDTFRSLFPFFTLMYPDVNSKIMEGLVNTYKESGWLPEWASPGHRDCMIGSNSASLIADSYLKGIRGYDIETLYEAIIKNTKGAGPVPSVGRLGAEYYNDMGYVPYNVGINENAARTLEYAYADFCIWQLAKELGKPQEEIDLYAKRSMNYKNVFDAESKLMRGRNLDGTFQSPFSPYKWGDAFTEGNSWHYTWSVFQDIEGLVTLMGGKDEFITMLDSVFKVPPVFDYSYYGQVIHEIREMQIMNMGNYAHGNQPVQHMIYLYNYAGQPWKTQYRARQVMDNLYNYTPDGYCGDEDNGQTSAWYVFSALGFYPVTPGTDQYVFGSPLFSKVTLDFGKRKKLVIEASANNRENIYVQSIKLNGRRMDKNYITHSELQNGGKLIFRMVSQPDSVRGSKRNAYPYSMSRELIL